MRIRSVLMVALFAATSVSADESPDWSSYSVEQLREQRSASDRTYLEFLRTNTLRMGFYELTAGAHDRQTPHTLDEVYYVVAGRAVLEVGDTSSPVSPGSIVFVKAGVAHRFVDIEENLSVVVFFTTAPPE